MYWYYITGIPFSSTLSVLQYFTNGLLEELPVFIYCPVPKQMSHVWIVASSYFQLPFFVCYLLLRNRRAQNFSGLKQQCFLSHSSVSKLGFTGRFLLGVTSVLAGPIVFSADGNVMWCSCCRKQCDGSSKIKHRISIQSSSSTSGYTQMNWKQRLKQMFVYLCS